VGELLTEPSVQEVAALLARAFHRTRVELPRGAHDLTLGQLRLFYLIRRRGPLQMGQISDLFGIGQAATSGFVERIERRGFIERRHRAGDRRIVECGLTRTGEVLLDELSGMQMHSVETTLAALTGAELSTLKDLLERMASPADQEDV
jgi:DNA-binding MarR family transcriptional regulator